MRDVLSILINLGVDYSVFIQLVIFILFYLVMKHLWLREMGEILSKRREIGKQRTSSSIESLQNEIRRLNKEYDRQVDNLYALANQKLQQQKQEIEKVLMQEFNEKKNTLDEEKRGQLQLLKAEIASIRQATQKDKRSLVGPLLQKFGS